MMCETYYNELRAALAPRYDEREGRAIAFLVLERAFGIGRMEVYLRKVRHFSPDEQARYRNILHRLSEGEPVQYVLGFADFAGHTFAVTPATLIPRPETEELVTRVAELPAVDILDAGTGSGCIAVSVALALPEARVEAWDVSAEALEVATSNARRLGAQVTFARRDILAEAERPADPCLDLIVSNPPYVCQSEAADIEAHVLHHEPSLALFVPDDDPQRFYRALTRLALKRLRSGGHLLVEGNTAHIHETAALMRAAGLREVAVHRDCFGRWRFARGRK